MITIILLSLFATAFSSTCKEQFSAISTIVINTEKNIYTDNAENCLPNYGRCLCNEYRFDGNRVLVSQDDCDNLNIFKYRDFGNICSVNVTSDKVSKYRNFVFTKGDPKNMVWQGQYKIQSRCKYRYSVSVFYPQSTSLALSISLPICVIIIITGILIIFYCRKKKYRLLQY